MSLLDDRVTSSFPISIGTALALEACFDPTSTVYQPEREMPARVDLTQYNSVLINIGVLIRNIYSSVPSSTSKELGAIEIADVLMQECEIITELFQKANIDVHYYTNQYTGLKDKYKSCIPKESKTFNQIRYDEILTKTQEHYWKNFQKEDRNIYDHEIKYVAENPSVLLITNIPLDLCNIHNTKQLHLLESYTGQLKKRDKWYTKFYKYKEMEPEISRIPFMSGLLVAFGDNELFKPYPHASKKIILDHAVKFDWNAYTTKSRVIFSLQYMPDKFLADVIKSML